VNWRLELSQEDKEAFAFADAYRRVRRQYQNGFTNFREQSPETLNTPKFKTARTLAKWFKLSWSVTRKQPNLEGYVSYVFKRLSPTIPHLGQLKNAKLLGEFIAAAPEIEIKQLKPHELTALYRKALSPELRHTQTLASLGLILKD